ncbi:MAG: DoxX family protein [Verrucomicrobiota bacterium]|nr:DoxX family protein [Verrucomicrobiota bacterium]
MTHAAQTPSLLPVNSLGKYSGHVYGIMRLVIGLLFACHGGQKILGFPPGGHGAGQGLMLAGGWIELVCGFLIAFGFLTRIAAFIAAGEMAVAYFMAHAKGGFFPIQNHGEAAVFYCFVFLYIFVHGPGWLSIDSLIWRNKDLVTEKRV